MVHLFSKTLLISVAVIIATHVGFAQQTYELSVDQAVALGLKNSYDVKNLVLDYKIQEQQNKELTAQIYPTVSASGGVTYYTNVPQIQFPNSDLSVYQVLSKEGVRDNNGNIIDVANASFSVNNVSFIQPWNMQFGLSINQLLFQPDVFVGLAARKTILKLNEDNINVSKDKIKESIQKAYFAVLITKKQLDVLKSTQKRLESLLHDMNEMYKTGFAEKLDVDKLQVSLNNTQAAQNQLNNAIKIGESSLKTNLGLDQGDTIVLTDDLDVNQMKVDLLMANDFKYDNRSEIVALNTALELQKLDFKRYDLSYLPTVSLSYQLQRSGQRNATFAEFTGKPWFWYNTGVVGLQVNAPIYSGNRRKYLMNQSKFKADKVENNIAQFKQYIDLEQEVAKSNMNNAIINLEVQKRNMELAEEVFNKTKIKYENGLGSSFEVLQADTELQRSQGNYFQALYDGTVAKVNFAKAYSKL